jgi:hypothetical protein
VAGVEVREVQQAKTSHEEACVSQKVGAARVGDEQVDQRTTQAIQQHQISG